MTEHSDERRHVTLRANMKKPACLADVAAEQAGTLARSLARLDDSARGERVLPESLILTILGNERHPLFPGDGQRVAAHVDLALPHRGRRGAGELLMVGPHRSCRRHFGSSFLSGRSDLSPTILPNGLPTTSGRMLTDQGFRPRHWQETPGQNFCLTEISEVGR